MSEQEPHGIEPEDREPGQIEQENVRAELEAIRNSINPENPLTSELLGRYEDLAKRLREQDADYVAETKTRFEFMFETADLKYRSGFLDMAIEDLDELIFSVEQMGGEHDDILDRAIEIRTRYEEELSQQANP